MQAEVNMGIQGQNVILEIMWDSASILIRKQFHLIN